MTQHILQQLQLLHNQWCQLKSTPIWYLNWIMSLVVVLRTFKNLAQNLTLCRRRLQPFLKKTWCYAVGTDWSAVWNSNPKVLTDCQFVENFDLLTNWINQSFFNWKKMTMKFLVLLGSTCICVKTFSTVNINKSTLWSNLSDANLQSLLLQTCNQHDFKQLVKNVYHPQKFHLLHIIKLLCIFW